MNKNTKKEDSPGKKLLLNSFWLIIILTFLVYLGSYVILVSQASSFPAILESISLNNALFKNITGIFANKDYGATLFAATLAILLSYFVYIAYLVNRSITVVSGEQSELPIMAGNYLFRLFNFILPIILTIYLIGIFSLHGIIQSGFVFILMIIIFFVTKFFDGKISLLFFFVTLLALGYLFFISASEHILEVAAFFILYFASVRIEQNFVRTIGAISGSYKNAENYVAENLFDSTKLFGLIFDGDRKKDELEKWFIGSGLIVIASVVDLFIDSTVVITAILVGISYIEHFTILFSVYALLALPFWITMLSLLRTFPKAVITIELNDKSSETGILIEENYKNGYVVILEKDNLFKKIFASSITSVKKYTNTKSIKTEGD